MKLFAEIMGKSQPSMSGVHARTALGNETRRRRKFLPDIASFRTVKRDRDLVPMDAERSHVPFPYDAAALGKLRSDQVPRFLGAITDPSGLPIKRVALANLTAMQNRVDTAKVKAWADGTISSDRRAVVVRASGKNLIADGHHRLAGAWLRGNTHADVRFLDLEPITLAVKRADWSLPLDIRKTDPDQRLIFGWASVIEKNGVLVVDKQDDVIPVTALEPAVYDFVLYSRDQGDMHEETGKGRLVESMMFTPEKERVISEFVAKHGGSIDLRMSAWWTGFHVDSDALWAAHKRGDRPEFSIGGSAVSRQA